MEPRIQYAKTSDGVSIAYAVLGEGPPLVITNLPTTHLQLEWQDPELRRMYESAARARTLVRYDSRGFGLSDRNATDYSLDAFVRDLEAIADCLELATFDLIAGNFTVPIAIAYAALHPDRLAHLVVYQGSARGADLLNEQLDELLALAEKDWELASQSIELAFAGWREPDLSRRSAALSREALSPSTWFPSCAARETGTSPASWQKWPRQRLWFILATDNILTWRRRASLPQACLTRG